MDPVFTTDSAGSIPVDLVTEASWPQLTATPRLRAFADAMGFKPDAGSRLVLAAEDGAIERVVFGLGGGSDGLAVAALAASLPAGRYAIAALPDTYPMEWVTSGWLDGAYRFTAYRSAGAPPQLVLPEEIASDADREARAIRLLRDLVNTPAEEMGPSGLQAAVSNLAENTGATLEVTLGDALLTANYPMIHAVGRAAEDPPRLLELSWGKPTDPVLAIVGKGVAFDTGGLNIKTGDYMRLMKKDMGGAAHAIALAQLVMEAQLPVQLKLLVPAVENSVAGNAFRPGDVLKTRKGLNVEIDNTDAEGRLILCDAIARAEENQPDLMMDFATLTGAARVALGPDLAPFYTDNDSLAGTLEEGSTVSGDPVWRMPLWRPYKSMLSSSIADISNSGGRMAGSITAAVYLSQFVERPNNWMHFDIWAWREGRYGRPAGGAATGLRAVWAMLRARY
ncbi:MAG: leucyl aminopeptidase family protein [Pseudomonadota bacterium]